MILNLSTYTSLLLLYLLSYIYSLLFIGIPVLPIVVYFFLYLNVSFVSIYLCVVLLAQRVYYFDFVLLPRPYTISIFYFLLYEI